MVAASSLLGSQVPTGSGPSCLCPPTPNLCGRFWTAGLYVPRCHREHTSFTFYPGCLCRLFRLRWQAAFPGKVLMVAVPLHPLVPAGPAPPPPSPPPPAPPQAAGLCLCTGSWGPRTGTAGRAPGEACFRVRAELLILEFCIKFGKLILMQRRLFYEDPNKCLTLLKYPELHLFWQPERKAESLRRAFPLQPGSCTLGGASCL